MGESWQLFDAYLYFLKLIEWLGYVIFGLISLIVIIDEFSDEDEKP